MPRSTPHQRAFTIIEMLVVVGIIAVLIGILLPVLSGARNRSRKTAELSRLRQINMAWSLYSNANKDAALPGYLDTPVQKRWRVSYKFPDNTKIPPAPTYDKSDPNTAGPWTWRLLPYLDYSHDIVHFYRDEDNPDQLELMRPYESQAIAQHPAFAYNGHYIGGYYEMREIPDPNDGDPTRVALTRFTTATDMNGNLANLISRSISAINRPNEIITFCSAAQLPTGITRQVLDDIDGYHLVRPPYLASERQWGLAASTPGSFEVFVDGSPAPIGRYTDSAAILYADGHVDQNTPIALDDMRMWVDEATAAKWFHE